MFNKRCKIYVARAMTGFDQAEIVKQAKIDKDFFEKAGLEVLCPVLKEKVKPVHKPLSSDKKHMNVYWPQDKRMIREANALVNMSPHIASLGVIREHGYARYHLWKKVVSIFPEGKLPAISSVANYEDDSVVDSKIMAVESLLRTHGTYWKRLKWRCRMYNEKLLKAMFFKFLEWFR